MTDKEKFNKIKKLADAMYSAAQYLTTDASGIRKAMDEYHQFIITEYNRQEPASEDLEKEIKAFFKNWDTNTNGAIFNEEGFKISLDTLRGIARYFAQCGAELVKKSDIPQSDSETCKENEDSLTDEDFRLVEMNWLRPQLDKSYANYGETKMMELTRFDGYAMLDAIEFGAQWQREQMMKDAIECHIDYYDGPILDYTQKQLDDALEKNGAKVGDKVKVIIIKE